MTLAQTAADKMLTEIGEIELADIPAMEDVRKRLLEESSDLFTKLTSVDPNEDSDSTDVTLSRARPPKPASPISSGCKGMRRTR